MVTAVVGVNWGDEGKGRMVDLLGGDYDIVARYQGGNNAGHTVINDKGKFVLNLLPSGVFRENAVNVIGAGVAVDLEHLAGEIGALEERGVKLPPERLVISGKAAICFPFHRLQDGVEEDRLADRKQGSTRRGIAPVYSDKFMRKGLRVGDLTDFKTIKEKAAAFVEWKNIIFKGYGVSVSAGETYEWLERFGRPVVKYIRDSGVYLEGAVKAGKNVLFEAQLGALRDIDYGIYPYTSSSTTLAAYAPIGAGAPSLKVDKVVGVVKAYSSCVGGGPFVAELFGEDAEKLRAAGGEYGAATGRPRRVGPFDVPATRYGARLQGADEIAVTKLDVMSYMDKIPVCAAYEKGGKLIEGFPEDGGLSGAKPVIEWLPGFKADLSRCRKPGDLPKAALDYVRYIENAVGVRVRYVSVGAERSEIIDMRDGE
jgi:adenylosuccinate synthase